MKYNIVIAGIILSSMAAILGVTKLMLDAGSFDLLMVVLSTLSTVIGFGMLAAIRELHQYKWNSLVLLAASILIGTLVSVATVTYAVSDTSAMVYVQAMFLGFAAGLFEVFILGNHYA